jgi:hypothetical protein
MSENYFSAMKNGKRDVSAPVMEKLRAFVLTNLNTDSNGTKVQPSREQNKFPPNVRLWDTPAIAGWMTFTNDGKIIRELSIPNLTHGQMYDALTVEGNSMTPEYNDGDIIIVKPCPMNEFRTDAVYLVALKDSAPVLKSVRLLPGKKELELNSFNPNIKPQRIEVEYVLSLYLVVAKIQRCG